MTIAIREKRSGGRSAGHNAEWERTYTRVWQAETSDQRIGAKAVKAAWYTATGITIGSIYALGTMPVVGDPEAVPPVEPVAGDAWAEEDPASFCISVDVADDMGNDGRGWTITAQYGPWRPREENPLDEPEEVEIDGEQFERICDVDVTGAAIVNSASDYFDPPVTRDETRPTLVISRNEPYTSTDPSAAYSDTVNDATFFGVPAGQVKCGLIKSRRAWHQAVPGGFYWKRTYPFVMNRDGWKKSILDQGLRQVVSGARKQITVDGQLATSPVLLNGTGAVLAVGGTPVYKEYDVYEAKDFSAFGFTGA